MESEFSSIHQIKNLQNLKLFAKVLTLRVLLCFGSDLILDNNSEIMRLHPFLAKDAAQPLAHSVWSAGDVDVSLFYIIVPFVDLHHQFPRA